MSVDALAMSGADYMKCTVHFEDTNTNQRTSERTPQYLLADESDGGNHDHGQWLGQARRRVNVNVQAEATASANVKSDYSLVQESCTCH